LNVPDPAAIADWYVANLGMQVVRQSGAPTYTTFLADSDGDTILELYRFDGAPLPDYAAQDPMVLHLAFSSANAVEQARQLAAAGAQLQGEPRATDGGDTLIFLRDPWGIALQLVERSRPLLG
jgi:catechol 2,3-dioxygenase-like lactoylglutathione lyase family enzyme